MFCQVSNEAWGDLILTCNVFRFQRMELNKYTQRDIVKLFYSYHTLQWHHNKHDGVSNHQPHDCLLNRTKKTSKLRVTGLCGVDSKVTGEFPAQMARNTENVSFFSVQNWHVHKYNTSINIIQTIIKQCKRAWNYIDAAMSFLCAVITVLLGFKK